MYSFIVSHMREYAVYGESLCLLMPVLSMALLASVNSECHKDVLLRGSGQVIFFTSRYKNNVTEYMHTNKL